MILGEFKAFIARGNVMDLAVGVIIGAAFGKIVSAMVDDVLMPLIGLITGGIDFSNRFIRLSPIPDGYVGSLTDYVALKKAGVAMVGYGAFITAAVNFLIMAFVIFLIVKLAHRAMPDHKKPGAPTEVQLLKEIRDHLVAQSTASPSPARENGKV